MSVSSVSFPMSKNLAIFPFIIPCSSCLFSKCIAFVTAVEYGSFSKAAEILNYSQSGISRMIADLEKEWKVTLLERNKGGVRLTSDGTI